MCNWSNGCRLRMLLAGAFALSAAKASSAERFECIDPGERTASYRVVGGQGAKYEQWPFIASIRYGLPGREEHWCGGSIIDAQKRWVLTAAHCVYTSPGEQRPEMFVRMVRPDMGASGPKLAIEKIIMHNGYKPLRPKKEMMANETSSVADIALIKLAAPAALPDNAVPRIMSPGSEPEWVKDETCAATAGWGLTTTENGLNGPPSSSDKLRSVFVKIISPETCRGNYDSVYEIYKSDHICAGYPAGIKDSCNGDSGGPLILRGGPTTFFYIGIVSFGEGCGKKGFPGVYTRASTYRDWIFSTIDRN